MNSIVVFCGSSEGSDTNVLAEAHLLGKTLAEGKVTLVYGAARIGVMGQVAEGCLQANGKVIGVIPDFLMLREVFHPNLSELIVTQNMHERKLKMHELSEGIIMLPGGYGTMEEFFEMLTWAQLGLHSKPIGILNTNGFYDELMVMLKKMVTKGFLKRENYDMVQIDDSIDGLLVKMESYIPTPIPKWFKKRQV